jgi:hypothetical protein
VILGGCTYHAGDPFLDESTDTDTVLLFLPAHSHDQTQRLNLGRFHTQKGDHREPSRLDYSIDARARSERH